ncbi:glycoside hydrolase family 2 protein [Pelagicoccus mobilis]|uniref:Beta-galactosidase n=1 Tax=Pelagicoccus mobilis TaxID=415221 RepID=A0A934S3X5_9BACT|nr:sugar-binding domain-containing protein [Pelagicoccus mobilis]MBK1879327.1 hypothetical protein [Pelagicoccus mobilis]
MKPLHLLATAITPILAITSLATASDDSTYGSLKTPWAAEVSEELPWPEYPRPQLVRDSDSWSNLNGKWNYAITEKGSPSPKSWDGEILVPFAAESQLSGVQRNVGADRELWYQRDVDIAQASNGDRVLLHFGAVDWECEVWINGEAMPVHRGGYDPFSYDITDHIKRRNPQEIKVRVWDPTSEGEQARGKQVDKPGGIMYTAVTGIWQTVWTETVPASSIRAAYTVADIETSTFTIHTETAGRYSPQLTLKATATLDGKPVGTASGPANHPLDLKVSKSKLWTPESPTLYDIQLELISSGKTVDTVSTYSALREVGLAKDSVGQTRITLNDDFQFLLGPLDQGWWPDGLYTAPTDEALRFDIEATKKMGFNTARKHVKIEPARWYYWADKLGLLVWQDMPSANGATFNSIIQAEHQISTEAAAQFRHETNAMVEYLRPFPSVIIWTIFNEGWGQHNSTNLQKWLMAYDPTRIVGGPSGWQDHGHGHLADIHRYPGPAMPDTIKDRALVLSEYGGIKGQLPGDHTWDPKGGWGYGADTAAQTPEEAAEARNERYRGINEELKPLIRAGLSAAIYTQTTDVEVEINGLLTYDRVGYKFAPEWLAKEHAPLYNIDKKQSKPRTLLPTSREASSRWSYTTNEPSEGWEQPDFDDSNWNSGLAPFGDPDGELFPVNTHWVSEHIWLRRSFEVSDAKIGDLMLQLHNNDGVEVYLNGVLLRKTGGWSPFYRLEPALEEAKKALKKGTNTIAVRCENNSQGIRIHFLDLGLVDFQ